MRFIELTKGYRSIVDDCDYDLLSQYKWNSVILKNNIYAMSQSNRVSIHRLLMNPPMGMEVDHINNDSLDNRRDNLRLCTRSQNCANQRPRKGFTSKYKGVWWNVKSQKWLTQITINYQKVHIGYFDNEDDAALVYNLHAVMLFEGFALLNDINTFKGKGEICRSH